MLIKSNVEQTSEQSVNKEEVSSSSIIFHCSGCFTEEINIGQTNKEGSCSDNIFSKRCFFQWWEIPSNTSGKDSCTGKGCLDYLILDEKGTYKIYYPWLWLILPGAYVCFVYLFHAKGGVFYSIGGSREFAYFFLDYKVLGIKGIVYWIIGIAIFILTLGYLLIAIDKKLARKKKPSPK